LLKQKSSCYRENGIKNKTKMKKLMLIVAVAAIGFAANAQSTQADQKSDKKSKKNSEMKMKEHVCTAGCKDGKHMYAHGEKGHVCTDECKKMK